MGQVGQVGHGNSTALTLILWRSGLGLLMGKFHHFLEELSIRDLSIFSLPDNNLSKYQGILTKLGTCIDIKKIQFGIANGQISSIFDSYLPATR